MGEHFIKNIDIVKFKCFENFSSSDFSRVNLISGKNNVGKTAFLEVLFVNVFAQTVETFATVLSHIKFMRENINILTASGLRNFSNTSLMENTRLYDVTTNINRTYFELLQKEGEKKYLFRIQDKEYLIESNKFTFDIEDQENVQFIDNFGWSNDDIISAYSAVQINDREAYLNEIINKFDPRIESFKVIDSKPQCKIGGEYIELTEFGDGLRHLISIVSAIFASKKGYLFIDEIDNGIHYTQLGRIWKIIFEVSKKLDCQVFATTHSKEMIEAFTNTAQLLQEKEVAYIEFGLQEKEIKTLVYDYDMLVSEIEQNHEIRGW